MALIAPPRGGVQSSARGESEGAGYPGPGDRVGGVYNPEGTPGGPTREIDAYRGICALLIVVYHVAQNFTTYDAEGAHPPVEGFWAEFFLIRLELVDIFFVLSAYLLSLPYLRAAVDGRPARPARVFLARRAIRIIPLYYIAVLVVCRTATRPSPVSGSTSSSTSPSPTCSTRKGSSTRSARRGR